jgi:NAD(P)H dehydrogenase (quinone)
VVILVTTMILVTGATGGLGHDTVTALLKLTSATNIAALVRDAAKATDLTALGVDVREGDYQNYASLLAAFQGIEKVLLVSTVVFTDRVHQHRQVIDAAKAVGVKHLFYTSIQRSSDHVLPEVTESEDATMAYLKASRLTYTILKNGFYLDALPAVLGPQVPEKEVLFPAGAGKVALVLRRDLAIANAALLTSKGHENQEYTLAGSEASTFSEVARLFSELAGRPIAYVGDEPERYIAQKLAAGFPLPYASFFAEWGTAMQHGLLAGVDNTLERLLGRPPVSLREYVKTTYFSG